MGAKPGSGYGSADQQGLGGPSRVVALFLLISKLG